MESERRQTGGNNICYRLPSQEEEVGKDFFKQPEKFLGDRPWISSWTTAATPTPAGRAKRDTRIPGDFQSKSEIVF